MKYQIVIGLWRKLKKRRKKYAVWAGMSGKAFLRRQVLRGFLNEVKRLSHMNEVEGKACAKILLQ